VEADVTVAGGPALTRRERVRAATSQEIIQTARGLLITEGSAAISLRAIAREMGMTAPALYRYFDSHEQLIHHVVADIFTELSDYVEQAVQAAAGSGSGLDGAPALATELGLITACQAFRRWSVEHPPEFGLIFGTPLPGVDLYHEDPLMECGLRFGGIFLRLYRDLWQLKPFEVPADDAIDSSLRGQLERYRALLGTDLPLGALQIFLRCWVSLYGTVTLEVFGHMRFALDDPAPMFELMLTDLAELIGLRYPLPT
jgi:AcrR family transcriptional regulator